MADEQVGNALPFTCFYQASAGGTGVAGLVDVTVDVFNPAGTQIVTDGAATEIGGGLYGYALGAGSVLTVGTYQAVFKTASALVAQKHLPSQWIVGTGGVEYLDEAVSAAKTLTAAYDAAKTAAPTGEAAAALTAYDPPTHAEMTSELATADDAVLAAIAALNNLSSAGAQGAAAAALTAYGAALESTLTAIKGAGWTTQTLVALYSLLGTAAATIATVVTGSTITIHRGDTTTIAITGLGSLAGRSKLWFTLKASSTDTDAQSIIQIRETTGLIYLNGAAAATPTDASLVVDSEALGNITITLKAALTAQLYGRSMPYDVQMLTAAGAVTTLTTGLVNVTDDTTRAVS